MISSRGGRVVEPVDLQHVDICPETLDTRVDGVEDVFAA